MYFLQTYFSLVAFVACTIAQRPSGLPELSRFEVDETKRLDAISVAQQLAEEQNFKCTRSTAKWLQMMFHDSGTQFMDGSLITDVEMLRPGNFEQNMEPEIALLQEFSEFSFADNLCIATSVAIKLCAGVDVPFSYGRLDVTVPDDGALPPPDNSANDTISLFGTFGLNVDETVAVIFGGHSVGHIITKGRSVDGNIGPMDETDDRLDNNIFKTFENPPKRVKDGKLARLQARLNLLNDADAIVAIRAFARDQGLFYDRMTSGMVKLCDNVDTTKVTLSEHFMVTEDLARRGRTLRRFGGKNSDIDSDSD